MSWGIVGVVAVLLAFGLASAWVNTAYLRSSGPNKTPPRWLAILERYRQYLANEGD